MGAPGTPAPSPAPSELLFLNNRRGGGIGDFGASVLAAVETVRPGVQLEETDLGGRGLAVQLARVRTHPGGLIANVGLTAWGASGLRNFRGFRSLGARQRAGRPLVALVHHTIEMFTPEESGYPISRLRRWGAHRALAELAHADLVSFSPRVADLLRNGYRAGSVWLTPMPTGTPRTGIDGSGPGWKIATVGYLAPYKGIDQFLEAAERLGSEATAQLIGRPHPVLSGRPEFRSAVERWQQRAARIGVAMPGYLEAEALDRALAGPTVGMLPYTSASGASASFGLFAERGVPVVASDLPEFRFLEEQGAGVVVVPPTTVGLVDAARALMGDRPRWAELAARQRSFSASHTWENFARQLLGRYPLLGGIPG